MELCTKNDETNPWMVEELEEFLYFCCPECDEKAKYKQDFVNHVCTYHSGVSICTLLFLKKCYWMKSNSMALGTIQIPPCIISEYFNASILTMKTIFNIFSFHFRQWAHFFRSQMVLSMMFIFKGLQLG